MDVTPRTSAVPEKTQPMTTIDRWQPDRSGAPATSLTPANFDDELLLFAIAWAKDRGLDGADFVRTVAAVFETLKGDIDRPQAVTPGKAPAAP